MYGSNTVSCNLIKYINIYAYNSSTILDNTRYFYGNTEINCCCCYISTEFNTELSCITSNLSRTGKIFQCREMFHSTTVILNRESSEKIL